VNPLDLSCKMGVKKFLSTFIVGLPASFEVMRATTAAIAIDMNQFVHQALDKLVEIACESMFEYEGIETNIVYENIKTTDDLLVLYNVTTGTVLDGVITELTLMRNLRELYITMDGTPCYGKIQNQIDRRRKPRRFVRRGNTGEQHVLLLSSALVLPGTPLMEAFTKILLTKLQEFSSKHTEISLTMSLSDISGEGEHKALDYLNASPYVPFSSGETKSFTIWSNDSDVVISLIHRDASNVFVITESKNRSGQAVLMCVNIAHVRDRLCTSHRERLNAPLLLAFLGNDYLPEMLDTVDLEKSYTRLRGICAGTAPLSRDLGGKSSAELYLTKANRPSNAVDLPLNLRQNDEVMPSEDVLQQAPGTPANTVSKKPMYGYMPMIDFSALRTLFRTMAEEEITLYYTGVPIRGQSKRLLFLGGDLDTMLANRVGFKREYYRMVYEELSRIGSSPITPRGATPTDSELYELEMTLATNYMKVYCWYYYYQSGMYLTWNQPGADDFTSFEDERYTNNVYYRYVFPPLYSSLYILLDRAEPSNMIQFDPASNPALQPRPRELDYFQKLPTFNVLHLYIVLQREDYNLLFQSQGLPFNEPEFETEKKQVFRVGSILDRYGKNLELSKRAPIEALVKKYQNYVESAGGRLLKFGRTEPVNQEREVRNRGFDRFRLRGVATF